VATSANELRAIADSELAKELADLVILRKADSSGQPVADRAADVAYEHEHQQYRLVPAGMLTRIADLVDANVTSYNELMEQLVLVRREVPKEHWPKSWQRAEQALESTRLAMPWATPQPDPTE
jgi:hypothetical protein